MIDQDRLSKLLAFMAMGHGFYDAYALAGFPADDYVRGVTLGFALQAGYVTVELTARGRDKAEAWR